MSKNNCNAIQQVGMGNASRLNEDNDKLVAIYTKIKEVAENLRLQNSTGTRADLAFELKCFGIDSDSFEVSALIWQAYNYFNQSVAIKKAFKNNSCTKSEVEEYRLNHLLETGNKDEVFRVVRRELKNGEIALQNLTAAVAHSQDFSDIVVQGGNLMNFITGTRGTIKVKSEAEGVYNKYTELVDAYEKSKHEIKNIVADFCKVRDDVSYTYRKYVLALTDIFGDSIKSIDPEMFDYGTIQFLEVEQLFKQVELAYQTLSAKCTELFKEISASFTNTAKSSSQIFRETEDKRAGLLVACLNMSTHYIGALDRTTLLKNELLALKNSVRHDAALIQGDVSRLFVIHKTMNDLYIPMSETFLRHADKALSTELDQLINSIYKSPEVKKIKEYRDNLLEQSKEVEQQLLDSKLHIDYYTEHLAECKQVVDSLEPDYQKAKKMKPSKPFFLFNWFTFGKLKRDYNREMSEWNVACAPVVYQYETLKGDIKLDSEELVKHQQRNQASTKAVNNLKVLVGSATNDMKKTIQVDNQVKAEMLKHLESLIALLRTAKEIVSLKLDHNLLNTVTVKRYQSKRLPKDVQMGLQTFVDHTRTMLHVDYLPGDENDPQYATMVQRVDAQNAAIQQSIGLFEQLIQLNQTRLNDQLSQAHYQKELSQLQQEFRKTLKNIDNKSEVLRQTLAKINTAATQEELKEGLLLLGNVGKKQLTDKEWDDFLNGTTTIEI